jgi:hypothetical protein
VLVKESIASTSAPRVYESKPRFPEKISSVAPDDQARNVYPLRSFTGFVNYKIC